MHIHVQSTPFDYGTCSMMMDCSFQNALCNYNIFIALSMWPQET